MLHFFWCITSKYIILFNCNFFIFQFYISFVRSLNIYEERSCSFTSSVFKFHFVYCVLIMVSVILFNFIHLIVDTSSICLSGCQLVFFLVSLSLSRYFVFVFFHFFDLILHSFLYDVFYFFHSSFRVNLIFCYIPVIYNSCILLFAFGFINAYVSISLGCVVVMTILKTFCSFLEI